MPRKKTVGAREASPEVTRVTSEQRIRSLAEEQFIRETELRANLDFQRSAHEWARDWWTIQTISLVAYPARPSEEELLEATGNPAMTIEATLGEAAAAGWASKMICAFVQLASSSIHGTDLDSFLQDCISIYTEKAIQRLSATEDSESRRRIALLIDRLATGNLQSMLMISHAQVALASGLSWEEVKSLLPGGAPDEIEQVEEEPTARARYTKPVRVSVLGTENAATSAPIDSAADESGDNSRAQRAAERQAFIEPYLAPNPGKPTLSRMAKNIPIEQSSLSRWRSGKSKKLSAENIGKLAGHLKVNPKHIPN